MAQANSFTVKDRESTPVSYTFAPKGPTADGQGFIFRESGKSPLTAKVATIKSRENTDTKNRYVRISLTVPVVVTETINGVSVDTVQNVSLCDANFRFDMGTSLQHRKNVIGMFANMLAAEIAMIDSTLTGTEAIW